MDVQEKSKKELDFGESGLRLILESIPGLIAMLTASGHVEMVNRQILDYFGQTLDELRNWGTNDTVHPEDLPQVIKVFSQAIETGSPYQIVQRFKRYDGVYRWFKNAGFPLRDENGSVVRWCVLLTDIDDLKRAEQTIRESERELKQIIDTIPALAWSAKTDGSADFFNQHYLDFIGLSAEQASDWGWTATVHPDDLEGLAATWQSIMASEKPGETEARLRRNDGEYRWLLFRANPLRDEHDRIVKWYGANTDIEDRKQAEAELVRAYNSFADAQRLSKTGSFITDLVADDHNWSEESYRIFEFEPGTKVTVERIRNVIHPDDLSSFDSVIGRGMSGGNVNFGFRIVTAGGKIKHIRGVAHVVEQVEGRPMFVGALRDVTESWLAEEALQSNERNLSLIINTIPTHIYVLNTEGSVQNVNQAVMDYTGLTLEDVQQEDYRDRVIHPEDFKRVRAGRAASLKQSAPFTTEQRVLGKDRQYRWFLVRYNPLLDEQGRIVRWYVSAFDIEDRKRAEAEREQSEETFRTIVETNPECVKVITRDGTLQRVNEAGVVMSGAPSEEVILGQCFYDFLAPEDRDRYREFNENICSGHKGFLEFDIITMQGERRHMETHAAPMLNGDGSLVQLGVTRDITERKRTLERLQANQDLLELAQKSAGAMAFDWYVQQKINHWSPEQESLFGLAPGTFDGTFKSWKKMMYAPDWPTIVEAIRYARKTGVVEAEYRVVWPDGSLHWLATSGRMFFDEDGKPFRVVGFTSDVTRRKMAEVQLAGEKHLLEMVATGRPLPDILLSLCSYVEDIAPDCYCGVYLIDWDGPKVELAIGPTLPAGYNAALEGLYFTAETGPCAMAACKRTQVIAADVETDELWRSSPFRTFAMAYGLKSCWSTPIYSRSGEVLGTFAIYQNKAGTPTPLQQDLIAQVTHIASIAIERAQREAELRRSETNLRRANEYLTIAQELSHTGSYTRDIVSDEQNLSDEMYRIMDFDPAKKVTHEMVLARIHPDDLSIFEEVQHVAIPKGGDFKASYRIVTDDGTIKHLRSSSRRLAEITDRLVYIGATQDVTEKKIAEEALDEARSELAHAARAMSLGVLTASIAHEVSQPLSGIITNASTGVRMLDADPPNVEGLREIARRIIRDGNRAADVISRLRALFGKKEFTGESVNLNEAAQEVIALSRSELQRSQVVLQTEFPEGLPFVHGDRVQLQQVILNLLLNAADAMIDVEGPHQLTISSGLIGNDQVQMSVSDVGIGFAPGEAEKLFEAFYTTKQSGMGIGLSVSRSIIERHQGRLWAAPNEGSGAVFTFSIPVEGS